MVWHKHSTYINMKSQLFIFAVLATLTPHLIPAVFSSTCSKTGLRTEITTDCSTTEALKKVAHLEYQKTVDFIFSYLNDLARVACGDQNPPKNITLTTNTSKAEILAALRIQLEVTLLATHKISPEAYSEISSRREAGLAQIEIFVSTLYEAIELAQNRNSFGNLAEIKALKNKTLAAAPALNALIYSPFRNDEGNPPKIKAAIADAEEKSVVELRAATTGIYNGIEALLAAECGSVFCEIESAWNQASLAHKLEVDIKFGLVHNFLVALFIIQTGIVTSFSTVETIQLAAASDYERAMNSIYAITQESSTNAMSEIRNIALQKSSINQTEIQAHFCTIHSGQETTLAGFDTAFNGIFDIIVKFTKVSCKNERETKNLLSTTRAIKKKVFDAFSDAHVATLAAIAIIHPDSSVDTTDWEAEIVKLNETVESIYTAIALSTNSIGSLAKIEEIEYEVTNNMVELFQPLYNSIGIGRSNQTDVIDAIKNAEAKALSIIRTAYHAIFSTIKTLFRAYSSKSLAERKDVFCAIEFARSFVSSITKDEIRNEYALIRTIFIYSLVGDIGIVTDFSTIQSSEKGVLTGFNTTFKPIFSILYKRTESEDISSEIEAAQNQLFSGLKDTYTALMEAFKVIQTANSTIVTDENLVDEVINQVVDGILDAILKTQGENSSENIAEIEAIEETVVAQVLTFYTALYEIIANISSTQDYVTTAIGNVEEQGISDLEIAFRTLFDVIKIIAAEDSSKTQIGSESVSFAIRTAEKTFLLTDPPTFNVTNLQINETTTQLAIWGDCGIAVVELPKRWGKDGAFQGGKEIISCRSHSLDERLFHCSGVTEVRRARWHPGSTKDCHLLVLTSENTFHLYECELNGSQSLVKTWSVGPTSGSPSKIPTPASLGEAAVDFDFVTPTLKPDIDIKDVEIEKVDWNDIEWPILVLKGNGDVCTVHGNILTAKAEKPIINGPLSIYPRADDNYGVDSCSIMCLQTTPPLVVIATSNGKVYHSILLREGFEDDEKKSWSQYGSTFSLHTPEDALFVFECVEMELGLCIREDEKKYSCPVHLHVDRGNSSRYFCSHNAGIHIVNLPMASQLEEYIQSKDEDADFFLPKLSDQSSSQYLVCTRTKSTQEPAPILGFGLLQDPCILIALLHTGVAISLSVVDLHCLLKIQLLEPMKSPSKKMTKEPFDVFIKNLLKHDVSQPILKLAPNVETSPQEVLELLLRATHVFRSEHFARQDKVQAEIAKRTRTLRALKTHQLKELESLTETRKELQEAAEHLAERYEDIKDKQEEFVRRAKEALRLIKLRQPSMSAIEKEEANELKKMDNKKKDLSQQLEKLKKKTKYQSDQLTNWDRNEAKKDVVISKSQEDTIKTHLTQMSAEVADLISAVESLQEEVFS